MISKDMGSIFNHLMLKLFGKVAHTINMSSELLGIRNGDAGVSNLRKATTRLLRLISAYWGKGLLHPRSFIRLEAV